MNFTCDINYMDCSPIPCFLIQQKDKMIWNVWRHASSSFSHLPLCCRTFSNFYITCHTLNKQARSRKRTENLLPVKMKVFPFSHATFFRFFCVPLKATTLRWVTTKEASSKHSRVCRMDGSSFLGKFLYFFS